MRITKQQLKQIIKEELTKAEKEHKKKLEEQEKQLQDLLNVRFGFGTWREMVELRRSIKKEREETIYKQQEKRAAFFEGLLLIFLITLGFGIVGGGTFLTGLGAGWW